MIKKRYVIFISIFLLIGLEAGATGKITKDSNCSWIVITTPENGDLVNMPLTIESQGSSDIDEVTYGFYADFNGNGNYFWQHNVNWVAFEPPYTFTVDFNLPHNSTLTVMASAYKYIGQTTLKIAQAPLVTVIIEESWLEITTPEDGDSVVMPFKIESAGSGDVVEVRYAFYGDLDGNGNKYWTHSLPLTEPPFTYYADFNVPIGEELLIKANGYAKNGPTTYLVAQSEIITVTVVQPFSSILG